MVKRVLLNLQGSGFTPFSITILHGWIVFGLWTIFSFYTKSYNNNLTLLFTPPILEFVAGLLIAVGAFLMVLSSRRWDHMNTIWILDKVGMVFSSAGWIVYAIGISSGGTSSLTGLLVCAIFLLALLARFIFTYTYEKFVKLRVFRLWKNGLIRQP